MNGPKHRLLDDETRWFEVPDLLALPEPRHSRGVDWRWLRVVRLHVGVWRRRLAEWGAR